MRGFFQEVVGRIAYRAPNPGERESTLISQPGTDFRLRLVLDTLTCGGSGPRTLKSLLCWHSRRRGASGVEYGLLVGLLAVAAIAAVTNMGSGVSSVMCTVATTVSSAVSGPVPSCAAPTGTPSFAQTAFGPFTADVAMSQVIAATGASGSGYGAAGGGGSAGGTNSGGTGGNGIVYI